MQDKFSLFIHSGISTTESLPKLLSNVFVCEKPVFPDSGIDLNVTLLQGCTRDVS